MIRPLRSLHRGLLPIVAISSFAIGGWALISRPHPPVVEALPQELVAPPLSSPGSWAPWPVETGAARVRTEGRRIEIATAEHLGPDLLVLLGPLTSGADLPEGGVLLGMLSTPGSTILEVKEDLPSAAESEPWGLILYSLGHRVVIGRLDLEWSP